MTAVEFVITDLQLEKEDNAYTLSARFRICLAVANSVSFHWEVFFLFHLVHVPLPEEWGISEEG